LELARAVWNEERIKPRATSFPGIREEKQGAYLAAKNEYEAEKLKLMPPAITKPELVIQIGNFKVKETLDEYLYLSDFTVVNLEDWLKDVKELKITT
jgi:hypothetical protein